jgi:oligopeptide/dipeptide ABC transporter ATP-binding protein
MRPKFQIIFQDPFSSLNPRMKILDIVGEALVYHGMALKREKKDRVAEVLKKVGLSKDALNRYPHEFSGGQRQRICIARAIALSPSFIVCDEAVSALDVSIQAQIINLFIMLQKELNLSYLFIAHDLSVVKHISNRIAIMYLGKIVETASTKELFGNPLHPYTKALLSAVPSTDPTKKSNRIMLKGDIPSPQNPPPGCAFHTRCPYAEKICSLEEPGEIDVGKKHIVKCILAKSQT